MGFRDRKVTLKIGDIWDALMSARNTHKSLIGILDELEGLNINE